MQAAHAVDTNSEHHQQIVYASPITNMLPNELLVECLVPLDTFDRVRASCVCRAWRDIALCATELWADVSGTISSPSKLSLLSLVIPRSGSRPLDVDLRLKRSYVHEDVSHILLPHIARIRHLRIDGRCYVSLRGCDAPLLETVHVDGLLRLPRAPRLRELHAGLTIIDSHARFDSLTRLSAVIWNPHVFDSLRACPNIVSLDLQLVSRGNDPILYSPQYRAPVSLVDLKLTCRFMDASLFLKHFHSCIALRAVHLTGIFSFPSALALYEAVGHTLHTLEVGQRYACLSSDADAGVSLRLDGTPRSLSVRIIDTVSIMPTVRRLVATSLHGLSFRNEPAMMPALESVSFSSSATGLRHTIAENEYVFRAPKLHSVVFYCECGSYPASRSRPRAPPRSILALLACVMRHVFGISQLQLDALRLEGPAFADALITEEDVQPISDLAKQVFHGPRALQFSKVSR